MDGVWNVFNSGLTYLFIIIITVCSILDYLSNYGIGIKFFNKYKNKKESQRIEQIIESYIQKNNNLIKSNREHYIDFILTAMGLKRGQLDSVINKVNDLKNENRVIKNDEMMINQLKSLLSFNEVVFDLNHTDKNKQIIYPDIKYYINFTDSISNINIKQQIINIMIYFIEKTLCQKKISLKDINGIIIPTNSNTVFGLEIAKLMETKPIIMHKNLCRIYDDQYWDGFVDPNEKYIIIHDVLFSGDDIAECINKIPRTCLIYGVFCLINRTDKMHKMAGKELIENYGVPVHSILELNDTFIEELKKCS